MNNSDFNQVKAGLVNFIGSLLIASPGETPQEQRHFVTAILMESALDLIKNENNEIDMYVSKPVLRATSIILDEEAKKIKNTLPDVDSVRKVIQSYKTQSQDLKDIIDNVVK